MKFYNGMIYKNGPPIKAGGYDKWNWCRLCRRCYTKDIKRCSRCGQQVRMSSKNKFGDRRNSRNLTAKEKRERRVAVLTDLNEWQKRKL
tara:strand:- start:67 stop:333 length:267 start_codon:yes stop_codon:yes gene_type:complete